MQKSGTSQSAKANRRHVQASMTLSRRYTKRPARSNDVMVKVKRSPKVQHFNTPVASTPQAQQIMQPAQSVDMAQSTQMPQQSLQPIQSSQEAQLSQKMQSPQEMQPSQEMQPAQAHPMQQAANEQMKVRAAMTSHKQSAPKMSAKELKDQAIKKALAVAEQTTQAPMGSKMSSSKKVKNSSGMHFGFGRVMLALGCAAVAVFAIVYFVNLNMPDISMRVAAMQTGIDSSYPNYVPRDFKISSITSEDGKIVLDFVNTGADTSFSLSEERSSWDTNALLSNYVKKEFGDNYTTIREQGLTIYVSGSNAAWVNGGIVYKINATNNVLTNKQIRSIATSL